jgi:methyl-accepting chemotaxis protein
MEQLDELIYESLDLADLFQNRSKRIYKLLFDERADYQIQAEIDDTAEQMQYLIERVASNLGKVSSLVILVKKTFEVEVDGLEELVQATDSMNRLKEEVAKKWPKIDYEMVTQVLAAHNRGEHSLSAEEMLCEFDGKSIPGD